MDTKSDDLDWPVVPTDSSTFNSFPFWCPRFWGGMRMGHWLGLLYRNGFKFHPSKLPWILSTTAVSPFNSLMHGLQELIYGRKIQQTQAVAPPVFILGHWRTGTTLLHELLAHDDRLASPSNYQVYATNHFLLTQHIAENYLRFLLPPKRPMDNVTLKWESPQEDEWARITMGLPSPYLRCAFSRQPPPHDRYLNLEDLPSAELDAWKQGFQKFLKMVTLKTGNRIVFKSPHNTGRVELLHAMYPDAKFIHVTRDPFTFFPSTLRMYRSFDFSQSLQKSAERDGLESYVLETGKRMYKSYFRYRPNIPDSQIIDVRYEDLVRDPIGTMQQVYQQLELGDIEPALAGFQKYLGPRKDYVTNRHQLPAYWQQKIREEWSQYLESFGYGVDDEV